MASHAFDSMRSCRLCRRATAWGLVPVLAVLLTAWPAGAQEARLTLDTVATPAARFLKDGQPVTFALYGFIEFETVDELLAYIDGQTGRWNFATAGDREAFAEKLLRKGVDSRIVSMVYEPPIELLITHTAGDVAAAVSRLHTSAAPHIFQGRHWRLTTDAYRDVLLRIQARWKSSLNCWSAAPSIPARVLSNWYPIAEGIPLFGATYDSTEHFWQAVKYHPGVKVSDVLSLLEQFDRVDWMKWIGQLDADQSTYFAHTYAIEFLRANLAKAKRDWFAAEVAKYAEGNPSVRMLQQRIAGQAGSPRFTALQEKILWGDLADLVHLVYVFSKLDAGRFQTDDERPIVQALVDRHFDGIYLDGRPTMGFISPEFQRVMLEIWKVKYLKLTRFGEVIRSIRGVKLDHFLNDGDSPDIPIPVYVGMLNQIRMMAVEQAAKTTSRGVRR